MSDRLRPYLFYDVAISICPTCYRKVDGKVVFEDEKVFLLRRCPEHGHTRALLADDVEYYRKSREVYLKTPEQPNRYNTPIQWGCPYDCGLCPDHEQHSCLALIELTDHCNLECPICYAGSSPTRTGYRSLETVVKMLDAVVANEGNADVLQLSGGEPTLHPQFFEILDAAKARPIKHVMLNTNGIRIANDAEFARRLATYMPGFEVYLQFDSLKAEPLLELRGVDLREVRERAIARLNELGLLTTLVVTLKKGLNDGEIGEILDYAVAQPAVRGVTLQPIQDAGRTEDFDPATDRLTLTEVRRKILEQSDLFAPEDVIPVPCHPDSLAMAYGLRMNGKKGSATGGGTPTERGMFAPLTGMVPIEALLEGSKATIAYEFDSGLKTKLMGLFSAAHSPEASASKLRDLLCCLPKVDAPGSITAKDVFRVLIVSFIDAWSFDVRAIKKTCVHIVHPHDQRLIPFDTYNLFYRDELESTRLAGLRASIDGTPPVTPHSEPALVPLMARLPPRSS
jgi:hypothetical protein